MSKKKGSEPQTGYKKPPKSGQFKPGQSGNPRGRPKGHRNLKTDLFAELNAKIEITEGNRKVIITKQQALVKRLVNGALSGDPKSTSLLIPMVTDMNKEEGLKEDMKPLSPQEMKLLEQAMKGGHDG